MQTMKQVQRICHVLRMTVLCFGLSITYGGELNAQRPLDNSAESIKLHGIVNDGKTTNRIRVGGVDLVFPPEVTVMPLTPYPAKIVEGQAKQVAVNLLFPGLVPTPRTEGQHFDPYRNGVRIEFRTDLRENAVAQKRRLEETQWKSVTERPDWGLRVYLGPWSGWSGLTYEPLDPDARTPAGTTLQFRCDYIQRDDPPRARRCLSGYLHPSGLFVHYIFPGVRVPRWCEVETGVRKFADSAIIGGK